MTLENKKHNVQNTNYFKIGMILSLTAVISFFVWNQNESFAVQSIFFSDDFSGTDQWNDVGTGIGVNTTSDELDWDVADSQNNNGAAYNLGSAVNDSQWTLRFKLKNDNIVKGSDLTAVILSVGLSDKNQTAGHSTTAQDMIGLRILLNLNNQEYDIFDSNNQTPRTVNTDAPFARIPTTETLFVEIKRTSTTTYSVSLYGDSSFTNLLETQTGSTTSSLNGLQYIRVFGDDSGDGTEDHILDGIIDDVVFLQEPTCNGLVATIAGNSSNNVIVGTSGNDVITGLGGNDFISGMGGDDTICGGDGDDMIFGNEGKDFIDGESGKDLLFGNSGIDELRGSAGDDRIIGGSENDILKGNGGSDMLVGEAGEDSLNGGNDFDICDGGSETNTIAECEL